MREIIIKAANEAFNNQPYDDVNMDEIAEKSLLSRATLYNYFDNKETLYFEVGVEGLIQAQIDVPLFIASELMGIEKVMKLVPIGFHEILQNTLQYDLMRRFMETNNDAPEPLEKQYNAMTMNQIESLEKTGDTVLLRYFHELQGYRNVWLKAIETGQQDGTIRTDIQARHLTQLVFMYITGMLDQIVLQQHALKEVELPVEEVINILTDNLRRTLEP